MKHHTSSIPAIERIEKSILTIRGKRVMLSHDVAELFGVETKLLNLTVRKNLDRFAPDFMFHLTEEEAKHLKEQSATMTWGESRYCPYAFTELGVAMVSCVLRSERAVRADIEIVRAFVRLRGARGNHDELRNSIDPLELTFGDGFLEVFDAIRALTPEQPQQQEAPVASRPIGFRVGG